MSTRYCDWMNKFDKEHENFGDIPLNSLILPGSHDSGAYVLFQEFGFAPDRPDLIDGTFLAFLANTFPCIVRPFVARFSKTQTCDVQTQLELGIRYLDLRVAFDEKEEAMKICHNLYADHLSVVLDDVHRFVQKFPKEFIILDFQHFHNFSDERHKKLIQSLKTTFEGRLLPVQKSTAISLRSLWAKYKSQRIIIVYRDKFVTEELEPTLEGSRKYFWATEMLPNPWPDTRDSDDLRDHIRKVVPQRSKDKLFVTQAVLTPNTRYSLIHFFSSLRPLADDANYCIRSMIKNGEFDKTDDRPGHGPNIIMTDFVNSNIVEEIVHLNLTFQSSL